jgi:hypothetical protein
MFPREQQKLSNGVIQMATYLVQVKTNTVTVKSLAEASEVIVKAAEGIEDKKWYDYPYNGFVYTESGNFRCTISKDGKQWRDTEFSKPLVMKKSKSKKKMSEAEKVQELGKNIYKFLGMDKMPNR